MVVSIFYADRLKFYIVNNLEVVNGSARECYFSEQPLLDEDMKFRLHLLIYKFWNCPC